MKVASGGDMQNDLPPPYTANAPSCIPEEVTTEVDLRFAMTFFARAQFNNVLAQPLDSRLMFRVDLTFKRQLYIAVVNEGLDEDTLDLFSQEHGQITAQAQPAQEVVVLVTAKEVRGIYRTRKLRRKAIRKQERLRLAQEETGRQSDLQYDSLHAGLDFGKLPQFDDPFGEPAVEHGGDTNLDFFDFE